VDRLDRRAVRLAAQLVDRIVDPASRHPRDLVAERLALLQPVGARLRHGLTLLPVRELSVT
jgi:hypothetical protein